MTVLEQETFDGLANGAEITTANTSFDTVTGTSLDATSTSIHGDAAMDINVATGTHTARWTTSVSGRTLLYARVYTRVVALPGNDAWFFGCGNAAASVAVIVVLTPSGNIAILQSNETGNTQTSTATFAANDQLRIEWRLDLASGAQEARLFTGANIDGATPDETLSTTASMADMADWRTGRILNRTTPVIVDQLAIGDDWIGPVGAGTPVGQVVETNAALAVNSAKTGHLTVATELDQALPAIPRKTIAIGQAVELQTARAVTAVKTRTLGQADEVNDALGLVVTNVEDPNPLHLDYREPARHVGHTERAHVTHGEPDRALTYREGT